MSNKEPYSIKNLKKSLENIKYEEVKPLIASQSTYTYSYEKIKKHFEELKKKERLFRMVSYRKFNCLFMDANNTKYWWSRYK